MYTSSVVLDVVGTDVDPFLKSMIDCNSMVLVN